GRLERGGGEGAARDLRLASRQLRDHAELAGDELSQPRRRRAAFGRDGHRCGAGAPGGRTRRSGNTGAAGAMRFALLLGLASATTLAHAQSDPRIWLDRMSTAVDSLNYVGTFVHITGNETETMRVYHRVDGDDVSERLVSLGGTGREVLRTNEETKC